MTCSNNQPQEYPEGIVVKEFAPKVIKFTIDELNPTQQEITHDTVHSIVIDLQLGNSWQILIAQRVIPSHQDLPIQCWISAQPYGPALPPVWNNLNMFSLLSTPSYIYVSETTATNAPNDPSLKVFPVGTYYINVHNRHGASSYYQMAMALIPV